MTWRFALMLAAATPAMAQSPPAAAPTPPAVPAPIPAMPGWNPIAEYITDGQDEPGYRAWYSASPDHASYVRAFNAYLVEHRVAGIVPTWQLLRTATSWQRCGGQPFEVPPSTEWPRIVQTLRYIHAYVVPAIGPVEPVSAYRNPSLNICAGGAPESAHKHYSAIDMVPLRPTNRAELIRTLCAVHARRGTDYDVGLGFYAFLRFHVDTTKFRRWGTDTMPDAAAACPPLVRPPLVQPPVIAAASTTPAPAPEHAPHSPERAVASTTPPSTEPAPAPLSPVLPTATPQR